MWARYGREDWDGPAGIDDANQVSMPPSWFIDSGYCAVGARMIPVVESMARVFWQAALEVGAGAPADLAVVTHPTHWGAARQNVVAAAGRQCANEVLTLAVATAVVRAHMYRASPSATARRFVVLECGSVATIASRVDSDGRVLSCEVETELGLDDSVDRLGEFADLAARVAGTDDVDAVLVCGELTDHKPALIAELATAFGHSRIHVVASREVARSAARLPIATQPRPQQSDPEPAPRAQWLQEPASAPQRRRVWPVVAAVLLVVALLGAGIVLAARTIDKTDSPSTSATDGIPVVLGRASMTLPPGWHVKDTEQSVPGYGNRLTLVPDGGPDRRITVTQTALRSAFTQEQAAATLRQKIAENDRGATFSEVETGVEFGGRQVIFYVESPEEYSQVKWHVIVENGTQVSVGCQFLLGEWNLLAGECERLVRSVVIAR